MTDNRFIYELLDRIDQGKTTHDDAVYLARIIGGCPACYGYWLANEWLDGQDYTVRKNKRDSLPDLTPPCDSPGEGHTVGKAWEGFPECTHWLHIPAYTSMELDNAGIDACDAVDIRLLVREALDVKDRIRSIVTMAMKEAKKE